MRQDPPILKKVGDTPKVFFEDRGVFRKSPKKGSKNTPKNDPFFEDPQKTPKKGGSKKGSFFRILVPFFGLSVGIPALKKWGGYPIFRSILRRVAGGSKKAFFGPFFDPPKNGVFGVLFRTPQIPKKEGFWDWGQGLENPIPKPRRGFGIER